MKGPCTVGKEFKPKQNQQHLAFSSDALDLLNTPSIFPWSTGGKPFTGQLFILPDLIHPKTSPKCSTQSCGQHRVTWHSNHRSNSFLKMLFQHPCVCISGNTQCRFLILPFDFIYYSEHHQAGLPHPGRSYPPVSRLKGDVRKPGKTNLSASQSHTEDSIRSGSIPKEHFSFSTCWCQLAMNGGSRNHQPGPAKSVLNLFSASKEDLQQQALYFKDVKDETLPHWKYKRKAGLSNRQQLLGISHLWMQEWADRRPLQKQDREGNIF